jgi:predicted GNAT family acetyltransferase
MNHSDLVQHLPNSSTFQLGDGKTVASLNYELVENTMTIHRTFVPVELRGQGVAALLAEAALEYAKELGFAVRSNCSYIDSYMARRN